MIVFALTLSPARALTSSMMPSLVAGIHRTCSGTKVPRSASGPRGLQFTSYLYLFLDLDVVLSQGAPNGFVIVYKRLHIVHSGLHEPELRLRHVSLLFQDETGLRRAKLKFLLFGFQP